MKKYSFLLLASALLIVVLPKTAEAANCWCADTEANNGACTVITGQTVESQTQCDTLCRARSSVSRHFDATGTYTAPSGEDKCGNYCWCRERSGENFVCNNHVTSPLILTGRNVAMVNASECSALCGSLGGSVGGFEPTYQAQRNPETCAPAAEATTPTAASGSGSSAARPSTPAPTVRLFNPLAGASTIVDIINRLINMIMGIVGAGALLMFIYGGIKWMTAGGDAKNVSDAQTILKNSTLGILLLMFSYTIITTFFSILR